MQNDWYCSLSSNNLIGNNRQISNYISSAVAVRRGYCGIDNRIFQYRFSLREEKKNQEFQILCGFHHSFLS